MSNKNIAFQQDAQDTRALTTLIIDAIQDNKGKEIALFDMRELEEASSDFFILCNGNSKTQILGIIKNIERRVYEEFGIRPDHSEGQEANWMLLDYFSVVIHVFSSEKRAFYNLDDLWSDAKVTKYDNQD
ncbi:MULTISPECIES: ribosome silencing factor [unclassified Aureispira]|uniref:ribosome silencing factor n=1 Tax=unclassified Aureispira TaxID=2649989 RepID=UPI00069608C0|nr:MULTISPECIES: ribosome silencing factor [unclassified Aureispira]WMX15860.1 ribosome silencing factor [Aureispira sp. CCB-E]